MKEGYTFDNDVRFGDKIIVVANYKNINQVAYYGGEELRFIELDEYDIGVWRIKYK